MKKSQQEQELKQKKMIKGALHQLRIPKFQAEQQMLGHLKNR